jgi:hypothetical protein
MLDEILDPENQVNGKLFKLHSMLVAAHKSSFHGPSMVENC